MGMFDDIVCEYPLDDIVCEYPLPDGAPTTGYQTKDTPDQFLSTYTITEDGRLVHQDGTVLDDFHGDLNFYTSNVCASGPNGYLTSDGKPYEAWDFVARFTNGRVASMTGGIQEPKGHFTKPPCTRAEFWRDK